MPPPRKVPAFVCLVRAPCGAGNSSSRTRTSSPSAFVHINKVDNASVPLIQVGTLPIDDSLVNYTSTCIRRSSITSSLFPRLFSLSSEEEKDTHRTTTFTDTLRGQNLLSPAFCLAEDSIFSLFSLFNFPVHRFKYLSFMHTHPLPSFPQFVWLPDYFDTLYDRPSWAATREEGTG